LEFKVQAFCAVHAVAPDALLPLADIFQVPVTVPFTNTAYPAVVNVVQELITKLL